MGRASGKEISASATRRTLLKSAAKLPPDSSAAVFSFPDGWSIRVLQNAAAFDREGGLMDHCLGKPPVGPACADDEPGMWYLSLRDPENLPHLTFCVSRDRDREGQLVISDILGRHNSPPKRSYYERICAWASAQDTPVVVGRPPRPERGHLVFPAPLALTPAAWETVCVDALTSACCV